MVDSSGRTLVCSVLFLDIAEYSKKPVAEQLQLKQTFNAILGKALEQVAPRDRIILDTGDGAAVTFMGDPEDALFASMAVRDLAGALPVRLRRSALVVAPLAFLVIVAGGVGARALMDREAPKIPPPAKVAAKPVPKPALAALEPEKKLAPGVEKKLEKYMGRVELAVAPGGGVFVDGRSRGVSPPLRVLD